MWTVLKAELGLPVVTYSKIWCHVHENNPEMDFESVRGFRHEANFHKRLVSKAWMYFLNSVSFSSRRRFVF